MPSANPSRSNEGASRLILPWEHPSIIQHSQNLLSSFQHWTGRSLLPDGLAAIDLFAAPFVVVSHGTEADPILNYGNRLALELWEMDWETFTQTPSRCTAEPIAQADRDRLLAEAQTNGYIQNYSGVRISRSGRRFWIKQVTLWTVLDAHNQPCGQAATFDRWDWCET
jgi:hypothetical protein